MACDFLDFLDLLGLLRKADFVKKSTIVKTAICRGTIPRYREPVTANYPCVWCRPLPYGKYIRTWEGLEVTLVSELYTMSEAILGHLSLKIFKSDTSQSRYINFTKNPVHIDPQQSTEILASKHICIRLILCLAVWFIS